MLQLREKLRGCHAQQKDRGKPTAGQRHDVGIEGQKRQRHHKGQHARQNQHVQRIEPKRAHGIDFLVDLHGADLGRKGTAGAAGNDDRGQEDAHLAQHRNAHEVDGKYLCPESAQLVGPLIGQHDTDQKRDQADDRRSTEARLLDMGNECSEADPPRLHDQAEESDGNGTKEGHQVAGLAEEAEEGGPDRGQKV